MMNRTTLRRSLALFVIAVGVTVPGRAVGAATEPLVSLGQSSVELGGQVFVTGAGWGLDGNLVQVQVCGNNAINRSQDCALGSSVSAALRNNGEFSVRLTVAQPPAPCPCVVRVTSQATSAGVNEPIEIIGAPIADLDISNLVPSRAVAVTEMHFEPQHSLSSMFGGSLKGTLVLTLESTADVVVRDPALAVAYGREADPTGFVAVPEVGDLAPGDVRTIEVPMSFDALSFGSNRVVASVDPLGPVEVRTMKYTVVPWGLVALAVLLANLVLWFTVRRMVNRRERNDVERPQDDVSAGDDERVLAGTRAG